MMKPEPPTPRPSPLAPQPLSVGQCATLACLLEVAAPKPGNVHRGADFEDVAFGDFLASAVAIGPAMEAAAGQPVGKTVLAAIQATRRLVGTNTNLGTVLLVAPLAAVPHSELLEAGVAEVLARLTADDARWVYEAIRLAEPGGLGSVGRHDVAGTPPEDLVGAMRAAADRDLVARQYADGFAEVFRLAVPWLREGLERGWSTAQAIVHAQMRLLARLPDSLIQRKCGAAVAREASARAAAVLASGVPGEEAYGAALSELDFWLRSDGHRRNPGTTADLLAAGLFAGLREGWIAGPW